MRADNHQAVAMLGNRELPPVAGSDDDPELFAEPQVDPDAAYAAR
jgi:hypothetical protein